MLFSSEVVQRLDSRRGLTDHLERDLKPPALPTPKEFLSLSDGVREAFKERRLDFLSTDFELRTPRVHSLVMDVRRAALRNRRRAIGRSGILLNGEPTMGKTTAALTAARYVWAQFTHDVPHFQDLGWCPVVYVEVPPGSTARGMVEKFAEFFEIDIPGRPSAEAIRRTVVPLMNELRVRLIIIDEVHRLTSQNNGTRETSDVLKSLTNVVGATFILAGVGLLGRDLLFSGVRGQQLAGRYSEHTLAKFSYASEDDRALWVGLVESFATKLCLMGQETGALGTHAAWLYQRTQGSISALSRITTSAAQEAILNANGDPAREVITREGMEEVDLDVTTMNTPPALK
jgi:hypothetical protein